MHIAIFFLISVAFLGGFYEMVAPPEDEIRIVPASLPASVYNPVVPASALNDANLVKQNYDYSCGAAALATVLNYQHGEDFSERQVIAGLMRYGDKEAVAARRAFSLLDMKRFVDTLGYKGVGYTASIDDLKTLGHPCIVPVTVFDYRHFVVFKGIYRGHVFVADPFRGNASYPLSDFEAHWYRNAIFVVYPRNGTPGLHALQLKAEDLRFIDEEALRDIFLAHDPVWPHFREWEMEKTFPRDNTVQSKRFDSFRMVRLPETPSETP